MSSYARKFRLHVAMAISAALTQATLAQPAAAQDAAAIAAWPNRTLTLIVPFAAGGGVDGSARLQAQALSEILGQSIIVENIGAAAGTTGSARVSKATPDGYTFLIGNSGTHAYSQSLYKTRPYDAAADFEPIGLVSESPRILIARKDLPVANIKEFAAYAKANQDKMQFGSAGVGSGTHLPCALLNSTMGVNIAHVPYRGAGPVMQDLVGGRLDYMCDTIQTGAEQAKSGTVKGIAVMSPKRVSIIPDLPTTTEQGLPGVEATVWNAFFFPKGTPKALVTKMNAAMQKMLERPDMKQKLEAMGLELVPPDQRSPEALAKLLPLEIERWGNVIKAAGIGGN